MTARPAWDTFLWVAYILGNSLILGPATFAVLMAIKGEEDFKTVGTWTLIGAVANVAFAAIYAAFVQFAAAGSFTEVGNYFDPTMPTKEMANIAEVIGDQAILLWLVAVVIGALLPAIVAFVARKKGTAAMWKTAGIAIVVLVIIGAIVMRVVFYNLGSSVFMFY